MDVAKVGEVYAFRILGGGYGAVQVTDYDPDTDPRHPGKYPKVQLLRLDLDVPQWPTAAQVDAAEPAQVFDYARGRERPDERWALEVIAPWWARRVDGVTIMRLPNEKCGTYSGWGNIPLSAQMARMLQQGLYLRETMSDHTMVPLDLGQGIIKEFRRDTWQLHSMDVLCPHPGQPIRWEGLSVFPRLANVTLYGNARGFFENLHHLPQLRTLMWYRPEAEVLDFTAMPLTDISLQFVTSPLAIHLPPTAWRLGIHRSRVQNVTVHAPDLSECFTLAVTGDAGVAIPQGVEGLHCLEIGVHKQVDFAPLATLPNLASLQVRQSKNEALNRGALRGLKNLRTFVATDLYGFDPYTFPTQQDCPHLRTVHIDGLRAEDAKVLKTRLKGLHYLEFTKARSAKWLEENFTNPFKDWDDVSEAFAKKAMKLWKDALTSAREHMAAGTATPAQAQAVVNAMVQGLNKLDKKGDIDTIRREEACDAIVLMVREHLGAIVTDDQVQTWIDDHRDW